MSALKPDLTHWLIDRPYAHRGLHGAGLSENGMAAFDAAIAAGFGIECDVRLSADGVVFIHHDASLARMTGRDEVLASLSAATIDGLHLPDGGAVPRLSALLNRTGETVPLLIEVKLDQGPASPLCQAIARDLTPWPDAPLAIMSFDPRIPAWFARHQPHVPRGLVVTQQGKPPLRGAIERALAYRLARPDFIACDIRDLPSPFSTRARKKGLPMLTWTVRSDADRQRAAAHADQIIFERAHD